MTQATTSRTEYIYRTMLVYQQYVGNDEGDHESNLIDMLTDLRHLATEYGLDFYHALDTSYDHYLYERQLDGVFQESPQCLASH